MTPQQRQRRYEQLVHLLVQQQPALHGELCQQLEEALPGYVFTDESMIHSFLSEYCHYHGITKAHIEGTATNQAASYHRTGFLAVLLLCYKPDKLKGLTRSRARGKWFEAAATALQVTVKALSKKVPEAIVAFKMYQDFKTDTEALHDLILSKYRDDGQ